MSLKENLIALVQGAFLPDEIENKITFLYLFESKIRNAGYSLTPNYPAPMPGSRSGFGRVDYLITCQEGEKCVVEIDGNAPRKRSIRKVGRQSYAMRCTSKRKRVIARHTLN
ncbi:hypothetical protein H0I55_21005 [Yersinia kristensenii]|uniref:hypothetical protein n=1 Tax=Yersinia kristensenii TaxID=28152 RepID=UPI001C60F05B|nr:hypothetical protein [Yersinia kristensenii]MBW5814528.1 hypothetical protein [Yersinia kristensenii]